MVFVHPLIIFLSYFVMAHAEINSAALSAALFIAA